MSAPTLAELTTLRVGGPAREVVEARTTQALVEAVTTADAEGRQVLLVGGGSNLLVADAGFDGTAVLVRTTGVEVAPDGPGQVLVTVAAGEPWDALVERAVTSGWSGVEALSGIPGSTGATPIQNVGAYGAEVGQVLAAVEVLDRATGQVQELAAGELGLGYRTSVLKRSPRARVVLSATFRLAVDELSAPLGYAELAGRLGVEVGDRVGLAQVRAAVLALRRSKGMVLDSADHDTWSAGSFFTNPLLTPQEAAALPREAPRFAQPDGTVKTSAAWLITHAGFALGHRVRPDARASLSTKHRLALTNRGGASAQEILELAREVRDGVADRFGIVLDNEPVLVACAL